MDNPKKEIPEPVEALVLILMIFTGIILLSLVAGIAMTAFKDKEKFEQILSFVFMFAEVFFLLIPLYYSVKKEYSIRKLFRFNNISTSVIIYSLIMGLSLIIITDEIDRIINVFVPVPDFIKEMSKPMIAHSSIDWVLLVLGTGVIATIAEEGLFRGFLQVTLEKKGDVTKAVLLSSATWVIVHGIPYWAIQIFVMGVFFGYVSWRTKSIWPSVIMHALNNIMALVTINNSWDDKMSFYTMGDHVSPIFIVLALGGLYLSVRGMETEMKNKEWGKSE